jgi:hypothetical protein
VSLVHLTKLVYDLILNTVHAVTVLLALLQVNVCVKRRNEKSGQREYVDRLLMLVLCIVSYRLNIRSE